MKKVSAGHYVAEGNGSMYTVDRKAERVTEKSKKGSWVVTWNVTKNGEVFGLPHKIAKDAKASVWKDIADNAPSKQDLEAVAQAGREQIEAQRAENGGGSLLTQPVPQPDIIEKDGVEVEQEEEGDIPGTELPDNSSEEVAKAALSGLRQS